MALQNGMLTGTRSTTPGAAVGTLVLCALVFVASAAQGGAVMQPGHMGCLPWSGQRFHIVVASTTGSLEQWLPWVRALGLSNADVYVYIRHNKLQLFKGAQLALPCNMKVHVELLQPNKGDEGAVYMAHILKHYDSLPDGIMFAHEHGGHAWHAQCGSFARRSRAFYLGLQRNTSPDPWLGAFARQAVTLSAGCPHNKWRSLKGCCATLLCGTCQFCPKATTDKSCNHLTSFGGRLFPVNSYNMGWQSAPYPDTPLFAPGCDRAQALSVIKLASIPKDTDHVRGNGTKDSFDASRRACAALMHKHGIVRPARNDLWSCCSMFVAPARVLAARPKALYQDMFDTLMRPDFQSQHAGRHCLEHVLWYVLDSTIDEALLSLYMKVDDMFSEVHGCPRVDWGGSLRACKST